MKCLLSLLCRLLIALPLLCAAAAGQDYRVNGVPMSIDRVVVPGSVQQLAAELLARWRGTGPASIVVRRDAPGLVVLGRQRGAFHQSVQMRALAAAQRVEVTSTVTRLASRPRRAPAPPLLPNRGLRIESVVETLGGNRAITFIGTSTLTVASLTAATLPAARENGWALVSPSVQSFVGTAQMVWVRESQSIALQMRSHAAGVRFVLVQQLGVAAESG